MLKSHINEKQAATTLWALSWALSLTHNGSFSILTENRKFLEKLAAMEDGHKATFIEIQKTLTDKEKGGKVFDPQDELSLYLAAMADTHGGEGSPSAADSLTGSETMEKLLTTAIGLEKESVLFYLGIKDIVSPEYGLERIEDIIREERGHIAQLNSLLGKLKKD